MEQEYVKVEYGKIVSDPGPVPSSYQLADGTWITGFNFLSKEDLINYGFIPVVWPDVDYDKETQDIRWMHLELNAEGNSASPIYEIVEHPNLNPPVPEYVQQQEEFDKQFDGVTIAFIKGQLMQSEEI